MSDDEASTCVVCGQPAKILIAGTCSPECLERKRTEADRIARLTELARRVPEWADRGGASVVVRERSASVYDGGGDCLLVLLLPRQERGTADALEAALLVLVHGRESVFSALDRMAKREQPAWVEQLAAEFRRRSALKDEDGKGCAAWAYLEAAEMLEARAKGGER